MTQTKNAPYCIASGLAVLILAGVWPTLPCVTAVALVGCGAALYGRMRWEPSTNGLILSSAQFIVYACLVALFVGARIHSATAGNLQLRLIDGFDFAGAAVATSFAAFATFQLSHGRHV